MASITNNFNALKKKHPGMSDSDAMKKAMALTAKSRTRFRKASKAKAASKKAKTASKKPNWVEKLKMGVTKQLAKKYHSPAARRSKETMKVTTAARRGINRSSKILKRVDSASKALKREASY